MNVNPFSKIQMVDDKANRFLPPSNMSWINNANLNDDKYKEGGLYCIGSASTNSPGNWGLLTVLKPRNDAIMQYYAVNNVMYHRDYTGGSWQSWKTFADTSDIPRFIKNQQFIFAKDTASDYTPNVDCYMCGWIKSNDGTAQYILFNDVQIMATSNSTQYLTLPVKKGTKVSTRSGSQYSCDLRFFEME